MSTARVLLLLATAGVGVTLVWSGALDVLHPERLQALLRSAGVLGPVLYVVLFALLEPFGVFGIVFVVPGSLVWSWPQLFVLTWLGAIGAGIVGFVFARGIGREWVARHLPERARRFDERLARRGFTSVVLVRLTFFLWPPAHFALGLSQGRFGAFVGGTAVGFLPGVALLTYAGKGAVDLLARQPPWVWLAAAAGAALGALVFHRFFSGTARERRAASP